MTEDKKNTKKQCDIHVVKCSVCGWSKEKEKECAESKTQQAVPRNCSFSIPVYEKDANKIR